LAIVPVGYPTKYYSLDSLFHLIAKPAGGFTGRGDRSACPRAASGPGDFCKRLLLKGVNKIAVLLNENIDLE
jgi:hypothetical protein